MKHFVVILTIYFFTINSFGQDAIFGGPSFRFENSALGINAGVKKELADLGMGGLMELSYYPYKKSENRNINDFYLTYAGLNLGGYYNFHLQKKLIVYPIAGMAINSIRAKAKEENNNEFIKSQIHIALGGFYGIGVVKKIGQLHLISNFRHEFTDIGSLKLFVGLAYKFAYAPNDK